MDLTTKTNFVRIASEEFNTIQNSIESNSCPACHPCCIRLDIKGPRAPWDSVSLVLLPGSPQHNTLGAHTWSKANFSDNQSPFFWPLLFCYLMMAQIHMTVRLEKEQYKSYRCLNTTSNSHFRNSEEQASVCTLY